MLKFTSMNKKKIVAEIRSYEWIHWLLIAFSIFLIVVLWLTNVEQISTKGNKEKESKVKRINIKY